MFGPAVDGESFRSGHPRDGGVIYDDSSALFLHHRYLVFHGQPDALEVGVHNFVEDFLGRSYQAGHYAAYSSVIEGDVQTAVSLYRLVHHVFNLGRDAHIRLDECGFTAGLSYHLHRLFPLLFPAGSHYDLGPLLPKLDGRGAADTGTPAGYQCYFTRKLIHLWPPCWLLN